MIDIDWDKVNEEWREGNTPWSDHVDRYIDSLIKQSNTNETDIKALKGEVEALKGHKHSYDGFGKTRITRSIICPPEQPTVEQGSYICQECGKDWGDGGGFMASGNAPTSRGGFYCANDKGGCGAHTVKWIPPVEQGKWHCPMSNRHRIFEVRKGVVYCAECHYEANPNTPLPTVDDKPEKDHANPRYWYECQESAFAPGIADGWPEVIPAPHTANGRLVRREYPTPNNPEIPDSCEESQQTIDDKPTRVDLLDTKTGVVHVVPDEWHHDHADILTDQLPIDDPSAMEGVDLGIINDQWVEIDRLKAENAELSDKLHDFEINDFRNTPDKVPESEGITEHAILSRYAPPPKAPVDDPSAPIKVIKKDYADMCAEVKALSDMIITYKESSLQNRNIVSRVYKENAELKARLDKMRTDSFFWEDLAETRGARHIEELRAHHKTKAGYDELIDDCASLNKLCDAYEIENERLKQEVMTRDAEINSLKAKK